MPKVGPHDYISPEEREEMKRNVERQKDKKPDPLTFTLADFERVLKLWDCKLSEPVVYPDGPPSILGYPFISRSIFAPNKQRMKIDYKESTFPAFRAEVGTVLEMVRQELNRAGFHGPSPKQTLAMIRMFDALESVYPQTELLARDAEIPELLDDFKWGLAAGVAVGLVLDDPEILEEE